MLKARTPGAWPTLAVWVLAVMPLAAQSTGQGAGPAVADGPVTTLRVFVDLVQVPVLVLDDHFEPMKDVDASRFSVSIDSGPAARPRHVRVEGDDPVALGVFLDVNSRHDVMGKMGEALVRLVPGGLHRSDHVTVFAMDCRLYRSLDYLTAQPALLVDGVERALRVRSGAASACSGEVFLWDALYRALQDLSAQQGRRVLMVVSNGQDGGSKHTWNDVRQLAQGAGVAIFGLTNYDRQPLDVFGNQRPGPGLGAENPFRMVSETSGGILLATDRADLGRQVARVMAMVRGRYVVEFSRPRQNVPGEHDLLVKVARGHPLVRPSGVSISIPDPAVEKDPLTIPRDTTDAMELGHGKILTPQPK